MIRPFGTAAQQAMNRRSLLRGVALDALVLAAPLAVLASPSHAGVTISSGATRNITCSAGVCTPTAPSAVLNVKSLEAMLGSGNVTVDTTASAKDITVAAALKWASTSALTLDADRSIAILKAVTVSGKGGVTLVTAGGDSGGTLSFSGTGKLTFADLSSSLSINGAAYTLVDKVSTLVTAITANYLGDFALARDYNAKRDGAYPSAPIQTGFDGIFEGLGNAISNLTIYDQTVEDPADGLFKTIGGEVRDFGLINASVTNIAPEGGASAATLASFNEGTIWRCWATGKVSNATYGGAGGLVAGMVGGQILQSYADVAVSTGEYSSAGGLVGKISQATMSQSFALGAVNGIGNGVAVGGLVGSASSPISQSYATGAVNDSDAGASGSSVGGLIGYDEGAVSQSYSTGSVSSGSSQVTLGGLIGTDNSNGGVSSSYWDTQTSGITNPGQGAGNLPNDPGITGLTTAQFTSGLPTGFDPSVWIEKSGKNNGFPYLLSYPPP